MTPIIADAYIITTAVNKKGFPEGNAPEIAFIGRSNVGKSSLINALAGRKALARTSQTPGKTRAINFFGIKEKKDAQETVIFVDLPGYGYAKVSKSEQKTWGAMIEGYLKNREQLKAVILLMDLRREPSAHDIEMYEWLLYYNKEIIIAATKADKLNRRETSANTRAIENSLKTAGGGDVRVIPFSAVTKSGKDELWESILERV